MRNPKKIEQEKTSEKKKAEAILKFCLIFINEFIKNDENFVDFGEPKKRPARIKRGKRKRGRKSAYPACIFFLVERVISIISLRSNNFMLQI